MASSITATTFKLFKKGSTTKIAAAVSYEAGTDTATLDPTNSLRGATYKACCDHGGQGCGGQPPGPEQLHHRLTTEGVVLHGE